MHGGEKSEIRFAQALPGDHTPLTKHSQRVLTMEFVPLDCLQPMRREVSFGEAADFAFAPIRKLPRRLGQGDP